jgi:crotonobetainyl-CoA:carnitine CoA-transferase CaiB-like acyl-CoA transferase
MPKRRADGKGGRAVPYAIGRRIHAGIPPWKMSASPCSVSKVAPLLGEDTEAVLTSLLKLSNEHIQDLQRREITV